MSYNIDYPKNIKKSDLIKLIEDSGVTLESYEEEFVSNQEEYVEAEPKTVDVVVEEKPEVETKKQDIVLLKMIHPRGALNVGNGIIFTIEEPFKALPRDKAETILAGAKKEVREATPEEVAYFYGVNV